MKKLFFKLKTYFKNKDSNNLYNTDGCVPFKNAFPIGITHVLAMFVTNITPVVLVCVAAGINNDLRMQLIQNAIFLAGIGTIIQLLAFFNTGSKLPIFVGSSFTYLGVLYAILENNDYGTVVGSVLIGAIVFIILGITSKYWIKLISPLVSGIVVFAVGLSLIVVGIEAFGGGKESLNGYSFGCYQNIIVGCVTLFSYIIFSCILKGNIKNLSILFALVIGYITCLFFPNMIDFSSFDNITFISIPKFYHFSDIGFDFTSIFTLSILYVVSTTETIGNINAITNESLNRESTPKEISNGLVGIGITNLLCGIFGTVPMTSYCQNVGIVNSTKVVNRYSLLLGAFILVIASIFPPISAFLQTIPQPVLGGLCICLFASIVISGIKMISACGFSERNVLILSLSIGLSYGLSLVPELLKNLIGNENNIIYLILTNCVASMFIIALLFDLILPKKKK